MLTFEKKSILIRDRVTIGPKEHADETNSL